MNAANPWTSRLTVSRTTPTLRSFPKSTTAQQEMLILLITKTGRARYFSKARLLLSKRLMSVTSMILQ